MINKIKLGKIIAVSVEAPLSDYIIAACDYLSPYCGKAEEDGYSEIVGRLTELGRDKLEEYATWLEEIVEMEGRYGLFAENSLENVKVEFKATFGFL